jgi:hypothetical protein
MSQYLLQIMERFHIPELRATPLPSESSLAAVSPRRRPTRALVNS